jgi:hypothetical protein
VYVIGPRPPVKAERVDLVPLVRRGLVYAEFSGAVWRVAEPARRWEPLRAKLVSKGYKVAQSYIPRSVRSYLEGVRRPELGGGAAAVYAADGVWRWRMGEERGVGCPPARYVAYWGQRPRCGGVLVDLRLLYRRGFWIEAAERLGDGWLLKAWRRDPDDVLDALYALAAEAVRLLEAFASVTGVGVDAILEVFETNSAAALAEQFSTSRRRRGATWWRTRGGVSTCLISTRLGAGRLGSTDGWLSWTSNPSSPRLWRSTALIPPRPGLAPPA